MSADQSGDNSEAGPSTATQSWPAAPVYDFDREPELVSHVTSPPSSQLVQQNFFRSARWCGDGTAVLTTAEDRTLRVYQTPDGGNQTISELEQVGAFPQPDAIHSTAWYPSASASNLETFCFVASVKDSPVRLVDATDGRVRASYPIVDHRERFIAPHCLAFNPACSRLYCGFESAIEVFDIANPGYDTAERLKTTPTRNERGGQKGIISALAFAHDYSGTYAAGSYHGTVSIYSEDTGSTALQHLEGIKGGGVTQVAFHPLSPTTLFVASRRSHCIQIYDLRDASAPYMELQRAGSTNQRLSFDVDPWGRYLASGDQLGTVKIWDIATTASAEPVFEAKLHKDAVGSVQLHPFKPLLLSVSGSRSFSQYHDEDGSDSDSDASSLDTSEDDDPNPAIGGLTPGLQPGAAVSQKMDSSSVSPVLVDTDSPHPTPVRGQGLAIWSFASKPTRSA